MRHFFFDTNVIIDVLTDRRPFSIPAAKLFERAEKRKIKIYIAAVSYNNIYYVVKKFSSHRETMKILKDLERVIETLDTTNEIIKASLSAEFKDFEDAIQYSTAAANKKIDALVTRDLSGFRLSKIPVLSPDEALGLIESETI